MPFKVEVEGKRFEVTCPPNIKPGQSIRVALPAVGRASSSAIRNRSRPDQSSPKRTDNRGMSNYPTPSFTTQTGGHHVVVPPNVFSGMPFMAEVNWEKFLVTCPPNTHPGQRIQVNLDSGAGHSRTAPRLRSPVPLRSQPPSRRGHADLFDVVIPYGVYPGGKFKIRAHGKAFVVVCPPNTKPGQKIRVPVSVGGTTGNTQGYQKNHNGRPYVLSVRS
mmetsp:Transcript_41447/g.86629  ORF Transcript_41447/g.86629 Transcript_41447/m.86629 type:complete len:218 (+) Transcript_41447:376-1029(+)